MGKWRDGTRPEYVNFFKVVAINPPVPGEDKLRICDATGSCIDIGEHLVSRAPFSSRDPFATPQEAEREKERLLRKFNQGCRPYYWSPWLRLEVWTVGRYADALDSGECIFLPIW